MRNHLRGSRNGLSEQLTLIMSYLVLAQIQVISFLKPGCLLRRQEGWQEGRQKGREAGRQEKLWYMDVIMAVWLLMQQFSIFLQGNEENVALRHYREPLKGSSQVVRIRGVKIVFACLK